MGTKIKGKLNWEKAPRKPWIQFKGWKVKIEEEKVNKLG